MKRITGTLLLLSLSLAMWGCSSTEGDGYAQPGFNGNNIKNIAIVNGEGVTIAETSRQALLDTFQLEFFRRGWSVIARANVVQAVDELDFQSSDFASAHDRKELGNILNVDALVVVNLASLGENVSMTAKMFDPETGEMYWMGTGEGSLNTGIASLTGAFVGAAVGNEASDSNSASGLGALVGGSLGAQFGPTQIKNAKKVVAAVCKSLPRRG